MFFRKKTPQHILDMPLLNLSKKDTITIGNACEGVHIFGGTGSGKTSGSGKTLAREFLSWGMGGLVLTAKPDELQTWQQFMREADREDDLIIFAPDQPHRFNFLDYECKREGAGGGQTENIVSLFSEVMESEKSHDSDPYWRNAAKQLLRNAVDLCRLSIGEVILKDISEIIYTAPTSPAEAKGERFTHGKCYKLLKQAEQRLESLSPTDRHDYTQTLNFWVKEFPTLGDKTRSGIVSTFTSMADMFLRGKLYELFCTTTNITPEMTFEGKVIIINLPVKEWAELGRNAQLVFKLLWQQAIERRQVLDNTLPTFLWIDEAQLFLTGKDQEFLTTARSSRAATVFLSQNMPNYIAALGEGSRSKIDSLLGNFQTKIFHQNSDTVTNQWASELIGKTLQSRSSFGSSNSDNEEGGGSHGNSFNISENIDFEIHPIEFTILRKGGTANNLQVDAIIFQGGKIWHQSQKNFIRTFFTQ